MRAMVSWRVFPGPLSRYTLDSISVSVSKLEKCEVPRATAELEGHSPRKLCEVLRFVDYAEVQALQCTPHIAKLFDCHIFLMDTFHFDLRTFRNYQSISE